MGMSNALSNMVEQAYVDEIIEHFKKEVIKQLGLTNIQWNEDTENYSADISRAGAAKIMDKIELDGWGIEFRFKQDYFPDYENYLEFIEEEIEASGIE
jgi:hypothetical protein